MVKLTKAQRETLIVLDCCTGPWNAMNGRNRRNLRALERQGYATYHVGYPLGFVITDAGRAALAEENGE